MPRHPLAFALAATLALVSCAKTGPAAKPRPSDDMNPFIGSGGEGYGVGSLSPAASVPFGLAKPGPDTSEDGSAIGFAHCAGYWWEDHEIRGFSQIHLSGTGIPDYGALGIMPVGALPDGVLVEAHYRARFDHAAEKASAGYYRVKLMPSAIDVEVSATAHTSIYRIAYPAGQVANLVVDLSHGIGTGRTEDGLVMIDPAAKEVTGWVLHKGQLSHKAYRLYYVMRFDQPFADQVAMRDGLRMPGVLTATGARAGAIVGFGSALTTPVRVQIGLSFVDAGGARGNLTAEWASFDLDAVHESARTAWDGVLGVVEIDGGSASERKKLYSALARVHDMPTLFTDTDGRFRGFDDQIHRADGFTYYTDFSLWDTHRTTHPLITLIAPDRERDFIRSLLMMDALGTERVKWPLAIAETGTMIGNHLESVLADSWVKGVRDFDAESIYKRLRDGALGPLVPGTNEHVGRDCFDNYVKLGYCAADTDGRATAQTLENAFNDFVLAQLAESLGHADDAAALKKRSGSWANHFNPANGALQGRNADGSFIADYRPELFAPDLVEGNGRQWSFYVPHDVAGLAAKLGGASQLAMRLEDFFQKAVDAPPTIFPEEFYWAGNEHDIHVPYMAAEIGRPDLTRKWVSWVMSKRYANAPAGYPGNDDGGTMSAWYVFSALGIYPKVGEPRYVLGVPRFAKATLHLPAGKTLVISAEGWREGAVDVKSVSLNGKALDGPYVAHADLVAGGELKFVMAP